MLLIILIMIHRNYAQVQLDTAYDIITEKSGIMTSRRALCCSLVIKTHKQKCTRQKKGTFDNYGEKIVVF